MDLKLSIDIDNLTIGDQMDLEAAAAAQSVTAMCEWLVAHAGVAMNDLRSLKLGELSGLFEVLTKELKDGISPSKANGAASSSPSRRGGVPRRSGLAS